MPLQRPTLCVICECPVLSTGIRVAELDLHKLSSWLQHKFESTIDEATISQSYICQFCLCDAKFKGDSGDATKKENVDWWTTCSVEKLYENYYAKAGLIRPCKVLVGLPEKMLQDGDLASRSSPKRGRGLLGTPTKCLYCAEKFLSKSAAFKHMKAAHKDTDTFFCRPCLKFFVNVQEEENHSKNVHPSRTLECHRCAKVMYTLSQLWQHIKKAHRAQNNRNTLTCCKKVICDKKTLALHMRRSLKTIRVTCIYCKQSFLRWHLDWHVRVTHGPQSNCKKCRYTKYFLSEQQRLPHMRNKHNIVQCPKCKLELSKSILQLHIADCEKHRVETITSSLEMGETTSNMEPAQDQQLPASLKDEGGTEEECVYCGKSFSLRGLYHHVMSLHASVRAYCPKKTCKKYFLSKFELNYHCEKMHPAEDVEPFKCSSCEYKAPIKLQLTRHLLRRHGNANLECEICGKVLRSNLSLREHRYNRHGLRVGDEYVVS